MIMRSTITKNLMGSLFSQDWTADKLWIALCAEPFQLLEDPDHMDNWVEIPSENGYFPQQATIKGNVLSALWEKPSDKFFCRHKTFRIITYNASTREVLVYSDPLDVPDLYSANHLTVEYDVTIENLI